MSDNDKYKDWTSVGIAPTAEQPNQVEEVATWDSIAWEKGDRRMIYGEEFRFGGGDPNDPIEWVSTDRRNPLEYTADWGSDIWEGLKTFGRGAKDELWGITREQNPFNILPATFDFVGGALSFAGGGLLANLEEKYKEDFKADAFDPNNPNQRFYQLELAQKGITDEISENLDHGMGIEDLRAELDKVETELATIDFNSEAFREYAKDPENPNRPYKEYLDKYTWEMDSEMAEGAGETVGSIIKPIVDVGEGITYGANAGADSEVERLESTQRGMAVTNPLILAAGAKTPAAIRGTYRGAKTGAGKGADFVRDVAADRNIGKIDKAVEKLDVEIKGEAEAIKAIQESGLDARQSAEAIGAVRESVADVKTQRSTKIDEKTVLESEKRARHTKDVLPEVAAYIEYLEKVQKQTKQGPLRVAVSEILKAAKDKPATFAGAVLADGALSAVGFPYPIMTAAVAGGKVLQITKGMLQNSSGIRSVLGAVKDAAKQEGLQLPSIDAMIEGLPKAERATVAEGTKGVETVERTQQAGGPLSRTDLQKTPEERANLEATRVAEQEATLAKQKAAAEKDQAAKEKDQAAKEQQAVNVEAAKSNPLLDEIRSRGKTPNQSMSETIDGYTPPKGEARVMSPAEEAARMNENKASTSQRSEQLPKEISIAQARLAKAQKNGNSAAQFKEERLIKSLEKEQGSLSGRNSAPPKGTMGMQSNVGPEVFRQKLRSNAVRDEYVNNSGDIISMEVLVERVNKGEAIDAIVDSIDISKSLDKGDGLGLNYGEHLTAKMALIKALMNVDKANKNRGN